MARYALTDVEVSEVRLQIGKQPSGRVLAAGLSDDEIRGDSTLGAAFDYVYEKCRQGLDLSKLTSAERDIAERVRDDNPDDVSAFINQILKAPQVSQFRRAVIYRTAGICVPLIIHVLQESGAGLTLQQEPRDWESLQAALFARADEEIDRLRNAFPDDAFPSISQRKPIPLFATVSQS